MKQYIILSALLLTGISLQAETSQSAQDGVTGVTPPGGWFPHFNTQGSGAPANNSRLVAKVHSWFRQGSFVPSDSVFYKYYGDRGGATKKDDPNNDENILFDESFTYAYNASTGTYVNQLYRAQQFDGSKVLTLTYRTWRELTNQWNDSARYSYLYNNGIMVSSVLEIPHGSFWTKHVQSDLVYDNNHNVTQMNSTGYIAKFVYDNNNNLISMVDSQLSSTGVWELNERKTYSYLATGEVGTYTLEKWDINLGTWVNKSRWEYTYSGADMASSTESYWNGSTWVNSLRHLYTYTAGNRTVDIRQEWNATANAFVNAKKELWEYNIHNQPTKIVSFTWNATGWYHSADDEQLVFYYEYYFPTAVEPIAEQGNGLQVYPTVAVSEVTVQVNWAAPQASVVLLHDMSGRVISKWQNAAAANINMKIPVSQLTSGTYLVNVIGENTRLNSKFIVSR